MKENREEKAKLARIETMKREFLSYKLDVDKEFLKKVPKSKHELVIDGAKNEIISLHMKKAQELIVKCNSPFKKDEINELKLQYRNFRRQKLFNELRLKTLKKGESVTDKDGKLVWSWEITFLVEKIQIELNKIKKELELHGLDSVEVLRTDEN